MITIEIQSIQLDSVYDFRIDEFTDIETVIDEVVQMFCQKELVEFSGKAADMQLYSLKTNRLFSMKNCLYDYDVKTGDRLILI